MERDKLENAPGLRFAAAESIGANNCFNLLPDHRYCGDQLAVCNQATGSITTVTIVEFGTLTVGKQTRILDLSVKAFKALGFALKDGTGKVCVGNHKKQEC